MAFVMDIQGYWEKALKSTRIVRARVQPLALFGETRLPYVFLAESSINEGDTVVRQGDVVVERPAIILPSGMPQFQGFESDEKETFDYESLNSFLLVRGVRFPSLKYQNKTQSLDLHEGRLKEAIGFYLNRMEKEENVSTGLVVGPEDCWQFAVLVFIASQVLRQATSDLRRLMGEGGQSD